MSALLRRSTSFARPLVAAPAALLVPVRAISIASRGSRQQYQHGYHQQAQAGPKFNSGSRRLLWGAIAGSVVGTFGIALAEDKPVDYNAVRADIAKILDQASWDDGSLGPVFVRLAWHASGTYDKGSHSGGSDGATMRYAPESTDGANAGLQHARNFLEPIKAKYPGISYADLWTLAGVVAIEEMGGPEIKWRPGRKDGDGSKVPPNGRLPDAARAQDHLRDIFYRMGFNDQEIVALTGAHSLGRCHTDRSGFEGPWTRAPTTFSNEFYRVLLEEKWTERKWNGPRQFENGAKDLMMLPADLSLLADPEMRKWVEKYKNDEEAFRQHFATAFQKLLELGCKNLAAEPFKFKRE